ncbi:uncharacterized protein LOC107036037 [Diachasma alloeum]|uniref:uncharacterized protein LOC107036037 n=1 Tax=Diachasma alloeum TaxID=454923 RepID=UPI000738518B|nr:uncharacterized protein LOC107036037 [Diachasma alloeum]
MDNLQWRPIIIVTVLITLTASSPVTADSLMGGHLDNEPTSPTSEDTHHHRPSIPPLAFNGGQPFSLEKDPVTGQIDFGKAPPFKALNYTGSYASDDVHKEESETGNEETENDAIINSKSEEDQPMPNEINPYSPSFHDYLNLPVRYNDHEKYTSDKYPLISNSYANTKVQGGSSGYKIYNALNHKNYNSISYPGKASTSQSYSNTRTPFVPRTTKRPTTTARTTRTTTTTTSTTTTTTTTTARPTTTTRATTVTKRPTTAEPVTTWKPRPVDRYPMDYDEDVMLPIEKMQTSGNGGDHFVSFPKFDYDEGYDYLHQEPSAPSSSSTTTSRPSTTTTTARPSTTTTPTTTTTTTTTTMRTTEAPTTEPPRGSQSPLVNNQRPPPVNAVVNGHQNYPSFNPDGPQSYPGFNPLAVESSSNVIVPPDQDTISFVLGNRQNVQGSYYGHGSAVAESPYGDAVVTPNRMDTSYDHNLKIGVPSPEVQAPQDVPKIPSGFQFPQRDVVNSGQKWWFNNDQSEKTQSVDDSDKDNRVNVAAGYRVVFPTSEPSTSPNSVVSSTDVTTTTVGPSGVLGALGFSELSDVLVPPAVDRPVRPQGHPPVHAHPPGHPQGHPHPPGHPPNGRPHYHYHSRPLDLPNRIPRPPNTFKIRPPLDINLPNILPQFRPNVKTSQRRGSEAIGTMIISSPQKYPTRVSVRPTLHPPPSHRPPRLPPQPVSPLQRLKPPPPPLPPPIYALRLPSPEALVDLRGPEEHPQKDIPIRRNAGEGLIDERNRGGQVIKSRLNDENSDKLEGPLPPRPPKFFERKSGNDTRVTTLQMIQHHGVDVEGLDREDMQGDQPQGDHNDRGVKGGAEEVAPVFVVYPVKGAIGIHAEGDEDKHLEESVVVGTHGGERPLPPDTLSISPGDEEGEEEEEVKVPGKLVVSDFPYPLERPDPSMFITPVKERPLLVPSEQDQDEEEEGIVKDTSINVIPYLQDHVPFAIKTNAISTTLHLGSSPPGASSGPSQGGSTPIAFVYTPTVRPHQPPESSEVYERNPVLLPSQQPSSSSSSAPSPQNFMAPFFASVSAEVPSRDGWSVVTLRPARGEGKTAEAENRVVEEGKGEAEERGGNSTASGADAPEEGEEGGLQTEASEFDAENFKPQLFGGFQPILEFPTDSAEVPSELRNKEAVGVMEKPRGVKESAPRTSYGD